MKPVFLKCDEGAGGGGSLLIHSFCHCCRCTQENLAPLLRRSRSKREVDAKCTSAHGNNFKDRSSGAVIPRDSCLTAVLTATLLLDCFSFAQQARRTSHSTVNYNHFYTSAHPLSPCCPGFGTSDEPFFLTQQPSVALSPSDAPAGMTGGGWKDF